MFYESYCYQAFFSIGERLPVSNVTQIEKDTVLVCNDSKYYFFKLINHFQADFGYVHSCAKLMSSCLQKYIDFSEINTCNSVLLH